MLKKETTQNETSLYGHIPSLGKVQAYMNNNKDEINGNATGNANWDR